MKKRGILRSFMITMTSLSVFLVLLWVLFYLTTMRAFINNMTAQAETMSDSVIIGIEDRLLMLSDTAYELSRYDRIIRMISSGDVHDFYDNGQVAAERSASIMGNYCPADNALVIRDDEVFYRLKGQISNTAVRRAYYILKNNEDKRTFTVSTNNTAYIGCSDTIEVNGKVGGYITLFMEQNRLKGFLSPFDEAEYLGAVITSGDTVICSNRDVSLKDLDRIKADSVFYREKEIGLTGLNLLVYCENVVPARLERYFVVAFPVTIAILMLAIGIFIIYWNKHIVSPINSIIMNTNENVDRPLPLTGEAYFDDLVEHVNDTLARIEERDKELYDSRLKIKESELLRERTLISLLKKQISAHFTVNTLNAVRALINKGEKEEAAKICSELSSLLRYANAGEEYISLLDEFFVLNQYASIMKTRYPQRFSFETEDDDSLAEVFIPRMLLQPVVENSIIHAFRERSGSISVSADVGKGITITVKDDGRGMSDAELSKLNDDIRNCENAAYEGISHVALVNIERRIRMVCGEDYGISVWSRVDEGTKVIIRLPRNIGSMGE